MKKKVEAPKPVVAKPKKPVEFVTFAIYHAKTKKFLCGVDFAKTGRIMRKCSDKYFMTFGNREEAQVALEMAECTSGYQIVEVRFVV